MKTIEELGDTLCNYCYETERGAKATILTPNGPSMCEGRFCGNAYDRYLEEEEEDDEE